MTYSEFIQQILVTRGQYNIPDEVYYEAHHIVPVCMGGQPNRKVHNLKKFKHPNLIWLLPREHFIAHMLLAKENPENKKLIYAFWQMAIKYKNDVIYLITAEEYEQARIAFIEAMSGTERTEEEKKRRSDTLKARNLKWFNNGITEVRASECPEGWVPGRAPKIAEQISRIRLAKPVSNKGEKNGMFGKKRSDSARKKCSEVSSASKWYNNGIIETFAVNPPDGYILGRLPVKTFTNGEIIKKCRKCPEGFWEICK